MTMSEWWTYRPSDFLMFSAGSHARLLEQYNHDTWPWHAVMLIAALGVLLAAAAPSPRRTRWAALVLAAAWAWVGWGFLWSRFAEINTAARYLAAAFGVQAALLAACAWPSSTAGSPTGSRRAGVGVIAAAVLLWPLTAPLTGRTWTEAEFFGLAPEPTALATLGWLLAVGRRAAWLVPVPLVSVVLGVGMLWLLYGPDGGG